MSDETPDDAEDRSQPDQSHPLPSLAEVITPDEANTLLEDVTVTVQGDERSLADVMKDLSVAHAELDAYKQGSMALSTALDERTIQAEMDGDRELQAALREIKRKAFSVYLRIQRGDEELTGERDGKYSGYFASPEQAEE